MGDGLGAGVTWALREEDADVGKSSQPGNKGSHRFVSFLFCLHKLDLVYEVGLLLYGCLQDLLHQVFDCDGRHLGGANGSVLSAYLIHSIRPS